MDSPSDPLKELLETIARTLVDHPEEVHVLAVRGRAMTVLELRVHPEDLGKVIGQHGRIAAALRTILGAAVDIAVAPRRSAAGCCPVLMPR